MALELCYSLATRALMQAPLQLGWETAFVHALRANLNVVIPAVTLLVKLLVRVFSRDEFREIMRHLANTPLELMLIAMSFMLGALSGMSNNYIAGFPNQSDADLFACLVIFGIFLGSMFVNWLTRWSVVLFGKLYFAIKQYRELTAQPTIPGTIPGMAIVGRLLWAMVYCVYIAIVLVLAFGFSIGTLAFVLHLIQ